MPNLENHAVYICAAEVSFTSEKYGYLREIFNFTYNEILRTVLSTKPPQDLYHLKWMRTLLQEADDGYGRKEMKSRNREEC